jgi:hypothetical protein
MKLRVMLKTALILLVITLTAVVFSWVTSGPSTALAQGGGGSASGAWMMVSSQAVSGDGYIYMFNSEKEVLLIYAFYRRSNPDRGTSRMVGDLEFIAGRHCKWDLLYSQLTPFPYVMRGRTPPSGVPMPAQVKTLFEQASKALDRQ